MSIIFLNQLHRLPVTNRARRWSWAWRRCGAGLAAVGPAIAAVRGLTGARSTDPRAIAGPALELRFDKVRERERPGVMLQELGAAKNSSDEERKHGFQAKVSEQRATSKF